MNHLDPQQIEELKEELQRQLQSLERSARVTGEAARPVQLDQTSVGRLSRMDSIQNQSLSRNLQEREGAKLALILAAQTSGGALGSVIAPTKIVVGASTGGMAGREGEVMRKMLVYTGILIALISVLTVIGVGLNR